MTQEYWTLAETTARLGVAPSTLWRWARDGRIRLEGAGRRKVVPVEDLATLLLTKGADTPGGAAIAGSVPVPYPWDQPLDNRELQSISANIANLLARSGLRVNSAGMRPVLSGKQTPQPILWRSLGRAIDRTLRAPAEWIPSEIEIRQIKELVRRNGIPFWEAAMKMYQQHEPATRADRNYAPQEFKDG